MWAKLTCVLQRKTNQISFLKECYTILFLGNFLSFFFPTNSQLLTNIYWTQFCRAIPLETHFPSWRIITQLSLTAAAAAAKSLQSCPTLCDPIDGSHQAPPSLGFSRQEHWSGLPFPSLMHESEKWKWSRSVVCDSSWPHGLQPTRLLHPWDFPGKSTGVGCHCLLRLID